MNDDLPLQDADMEAARKRAADEAALAEQNLAGDLKWLMSSPRGRRFMRWLLGFCGVRRLSFNNSGSVTAFNEGQRNVGLALEANLLEHCHGSYLTMLEEQQKAK